MAKVKFKMLQNIFIKFSNENFYINSTLVVTTYRYTYQVEETDLFREDTRLVQILRHTYGR
jgi:hypothetical protein